VHRYANPIHHHIWSILLHQITPGAGPVSGLRMSAGFAYRASASEPPNCRGVLPLLPQVGDGMPRAGAGSEDCCQIVRQCLCNGAGPWANLTESLETVLGVCHHHRPGPLGGLEQSGPPPHPTRAAPFPQVRNGSQSIQRSWPPLPLRPMRA